MTNEDLDTWALDTNGALLSDGEKAELEMLDVDDDGRLTCALYLCCSGSQDADSCPIRCKGFIQLYQLQTENDDDETWKDLVGPSYSHLFWASRSLAFPDRQSTVSTVNYT